MAGRDEQSQAVSRVKDFVSRDSNAQSNKVMFYVYVLQSQQDQGLYIGYSSDLKNRLRQHGAGEATATAGRRPLKLVYYEGYFMEEDATGRETESFKPLMDIN